jgi:DNA replication licensing factor MCM5
MAYTSIHTMPQGIEPPYFQLQLSSNEVPQALRTLKSSNIGSLINVSAIVINSGKTTLRGKKIIAKCKGCGHTREYILTCGYEGVSLPFICGKPREAG